MVKTFLISAGIAVMLCAAPGMAHSQQNLSEQIFSFQSEIQVSRDGSMTVTETITVRACHRQIKHGIYRDFPTRYRDQYRNRYIVDFQVLQVLRDDDPEPYSIEDLSNGKRVKIGSPDVFVPPGVHTYAITYKTNRQIGFFKDFDELYWNVNGNGWDFPIKTVRAKVSMPPEISGRIRSYEAYTGPAGARLKDYSAFIDDSGRIVFASTKPLAPAEGLTIAITWPKGYIAQPSAQTRALYYMRDNAGALISLFGSAILIAYYLLVWYRFGKDPAKGIIIPLYKPPDNLTPQAVRYIMKMGYDSKVFGCAVIDMAVKGFLSIREEAGVYTLRKTGADATDLSPDEQELARTLLSPGEVRLVNTQHETVSAAISGLKSHLKRAYEKTFFLTNIRYFIPGLVVSGVILMTCVYSQAGPDLPVALFMSFWLTFWSCGVFVLLGMVITAWNGYIRSGRRSPSALGQALFLSAFSVPFVLGELFGMGVFMSTAGIATVPLLIALVAINLLFYHLLKAPTLAGRRVMDKIEGFKMYLGTAEKDRLNTLYALQSSPELFEQYLPFALALDVEQAWAERFSAGLKTAGAHGEPYRPHWYSGAAWSTLGVSAFASTLGGSVSAAISSASHAPGSSSGSGGGGSSGGGGGGGGGGGW